MFSDESKFCLGSTSMQYVRRPVGYRYDEKFVSTASNRSVAHSMIWGTFSVSGFTDLISIHEYCDILHDNLLPKWSVLAPQGGIFQQDNAPIHTARVTKDFLERKGIETLDWPALSPDMNPIENIWGIVERKLHREFEKPKDSDELFATLQFIWIEIMDNNNFRETLVKSMISRIADLKECNGGYTSY